MIFKLSSEKKKVRKLGVHQCLGLYLIALLNLQNVFSNQAPAHQNGHTIVHLTFFDCCLVRSAPQKLKMNGVFPLCLKDRYSSICLFTPNK